MIVFLLNDELCTDVASALIEIEALSDGVASVPEGSGDTDSEKDGSNEFESPDGDVDADGDRMTVEENVDEVDAVTFCSGCTE